MAPEPAWRGKPFNREKFLLILFMCAVFLQYGILTVGIGLCTQISYSRMSRGMGPIPPEHNANCLKIGDRLETVFELSVSTILALLAGGAAIGAMRHPHGGSSDPRDPRQGPPTR